MRKISLILAVLLFVAPAWARVDIECAFDNDVVTVSYRVTEDEPNKVRAFALDITVDKGAITDVNDEVSDYYYIYPGSIVIVDGVVVDDGNAVADPCDHPDTLGGISTSGITVEMGALYSPPDDGSPNAPPAQSNVNFYELLTFTISDTGACVTIAENGIRGGVVMTDPTIDPDVNSPGCCGGPPPCLTPETAPGYYDAWIAAGQLLGLPEGHGPDCWCYPRQCHGDADGIMTGNIFVGYTYVGPTDLAILANNWKILEPPKGPGIATTPDGICADFAHDLTGNIFVGYTYVGPTDLAILANNWKILEPPKGPGIPGDCGGTLEP